MGAVDRPDIGFVEALCHLRLQAARAGARLELRGASPRLRELIELAGLGDVLRCEASGVDARGQAEEREEAGGVEEEGDAADPLA